MTEKSLKILFLSAEAVPFATANTDRAPLDRSRRAWPECPRAI